MSPCSLLEVNIVYLVATCKFSHLLRVIECVIGPLVRQRRHNSPIRLRCRLFFAPYVDLHVYPQLRRCASPGKLVFCNRSSRNRRSVDDGKQMQTLAVERRAVADSPLDGLLAWFTGQQPPQVTKLQNQPTKQHKLQKTS